MCLRKTHSERAMGLFICFNKKEWVSISFVELQYYI